MDDEKQSVEVFIPTVTVQTDPPSLGQAKEEAADRRADAARKDKEQ